MLYNDAFHKCTNHGDTIVFVCEETYEDLYNDIDFYIAKDGLEINVYAIEESFSYCITEYPTIELDDKETDEYYHFYGYDYSSDPIKEFEVTLDENLNVTPENFLQVIDRLRKIKAFI